MTNYVLTEKDEYYLASIARMLPGASLPDDLPRRCGDIVGVTELASLRALQKTFENACKGLEGPSLASEIAFDNADHLDCMIDAASRIARNAA